MKTIIVTGFGPFGPYAFNPTQDLAEEYHRGVITGTERIIGLVLPCTYFGGFELLSKIIDKEKPCAIISLGLASGVRALRIETTFRNIMNGKYKDAKGSWGNNRPITEDAFGKEFVESTADNLRLANMLHKNKISVELSANADTFIGNSLGYLLTQKIMKEFLSIQNMFMHIPWTDNYSPVIELEPPKIFFPKKKVQAALDLLIQHI